MTKDQLNQVHAAPLFSKLTLAQLSCLEPGEVIEEPTGAVLASEGEQTGFFHVLLEGELRITRTYDRQSILIDVGKPGSFVGETMLMLDRGSC